MITLALMLAATTSLPLDATSSLPVPEWGKVAQNPLLYTIAIPVIVNALGKYLAMLRGNVIVLSIAGLLSGISGLLLVLAGGATADIPAALQGLVTAGLIFASVVMTVGSKNKG